MLKNIERHLKTKIIPFWKKLHDYEYDGFYGSVDSFTLEINKHAQKGLVQQARILWSFSALSNHFMTDEYSLYIKSAYRFVMNSLKDSMNQGYYWLSNYQGKILDDRKIVYGQGFVIYALAEYYKATKDQAAIDEAMNLFHLIEHYAKDENTHAYWEEFDRTWQKSDCLILGDGVVNTVYTLNTTLHLLEAYTNLFDATKNVNVREAIIAILFFFKDHLYNPEKKSLYCYLDANLQSLNKIISYGHNIETAWLIDEACEKIGFSDDFISNMTNELAEEVYRDGFYNQYVHNHRLNDSRDDSIVWWIQSESLTGFYNHYQKTHEYTYLNACEKIWETVNQCLVDPRTDGEWFWSCKECFKPNYERGEAELWKTPYHNSRALMELLERMKKDVNTSEVHQTSKPAQTTHQPKE